MNPLTLVNGAPADAVPVADRGFQYGDGVFTTLPVSGGIPALWSRHLARLERDARRLAIPPPDPLTLKAEIRRLLAGRADGILKIQWTRGSGGRGYRPPDDPAPLRVLALHPPPDYPPEWRTAGVGVRICRTRLGRNPALAGLKHMNRLEQVLARSEWNDPAIPEGLMLDSDGCLIEGTMSNLFLVKSGRLLTPRLDQCGVAGVIRGVILDGAEALELDCDARTLELADLWTADEAFLTNSVIGIWPIRQCEGREFGVGSLTRQVETWLQERILAESAAWSA